MISILGQNIKRLREQKELSQGMLAKISDVSKSSINKIENGFLNNLTSDNIIKLAKALEVSTDELLKLEDEISYEVETIEEALKVILVDDDLKLDGKELNDIEKELLNNGINNIIDTIRLLRSKEK